MEAPPHALTASDGSRGVAASQAHAAIHAAFIAFHRNAGSIPSIAPSRRLRIGGSAWTFLALSLVGFGGGLFLAFFCFNGPDQPITVAGVAPELIYTRPTASPEIAQQNVNAGQNVASATIAPAGDHDGTAAAHDAVTVAARRRNSHGDVNDGDAGELVAAQTPLPPATANFAAAEKLGFAASGVNRSGGDALQVGFDAEELPSIPEPATGGTTAVALAMLIAARRFAGKRRAAS